MKLHTQSNTTRSLNAAIPLDPKVVQSLVSDLMPHKPWIYWIDLVISATVGWGAFWICVYSEALTLKLGLGVVASLALFRGLFFIHEISHFSKNSDVTFFKWAWNFLIGIPILIPSFMYEGVHLDHHRRDRFGTLQDPEYFPIARGSRFGLVVFLLKGFLFPVLFALRGLILAPLGILIPKFHLFLERHASSLVINERYIRTDVTPAFRKEMKFVEICIALYAWGLVIAYFKGYVPGTFVRDWYLIIFFTALVNHVRTMVAHRYTNDWSQMSLDEQLRDSVNVEGGWITELWAPVGARYHALHHYIPKMPYHSLGIAHRRIKKAMTQTTSYTLATEPSFYSAFSNLLKNTGAKIAESSSEESRGSNESLVKS